jgi:hypothetical protein
VIAPTVDRVGNIRGLLDEAKSNLCIGWDSTERQMEPAKVLEALCSIECALKELSLLEGNLEREDADDDEQSVSDEREAEDSVALARSMQQRRHGGSP